MAYDSAENEYSIYIPVSPAGGSAEKFYHASSDNKLREQIAMIVAEEGPILKSTLVRRVAKFWQLNRYNRNVEARINAIFPPWVTTAGAEESFVWCEPRISPASRHFRGANSFPSSKRKAEEVCLEELGNIAIYVLDDGIEMTMDELTRRICRVIGTRSSQAALERVNGALKIPRIRNAVESSGKLITVMV